MVKLLFYQFLVGVPTVIMSKFHPDDCCRAIERYHVTATFIVPPIILALTHHPGSYHTM